MAGIQGHFGSKLDIFAIDVGSRHSVVRYRRQKKHAVFFLGFIHHAGDNHAAIAVAHQDNIIQLLKFNKLTISCICVLRSISAWARCIRSPKPVRWDDTLCPSSLSRLSMSFNPSRRRSCRELKHRCVEFYPYYDCRRTGRK